MEAGSKHWRFSERIEVNNSFTSVPSSGPTIALGFHGGDSRARQHQESWRPYCDHPLHDPLHLRLHPCHGRPLLSALQVVHQAIQVVKNYIKKMLVDYGTFQRFFSNYYRISKNLVFSQTAQKKTTFGCKKKKLSTKIFCFPQHKLLKKRVEYETFVFVF